MKPSIKTKLLVCGGMPRSGTTYLYDEISNYNNVYKSRIKESYLFTKADLFIDLKLKTLSKDKIFLDFSPDYIFDKAALQKILSRDTNCFFIIREYQDYKGSIKRYLDVNKIQNEKLKHISKTEYDEAVNFVRMNFLTFEFNDIKFDFDNVIQKLQNNFDLDFGEKISQGSNKNASATRQYRVKSVLFNRLNRVINVVRYVFFGLI